MINKKLRWYPSVGSFIHLITKRPFSLFSFSGRSVVEHFPAKDQRDVVVVREDGRTLMEAAAIVPAHLRITDVSFFSFSFSFLPGRGLSLER